MNDHHILVVNPGSSSIKFALFRITGLSFEILCNGAINGLGAVPLFSATLFKQLSSQSLNSDSTSHPLKTNDVYQELSGWLSRHYEQLEMTAIAYRVVHGGDLYNEPVSIDNRVLQDLISLYPLAPLHQPHCIDTIQHFMKNWPNASHWACFDTAFHRTMPKIAQTFALPQHIRIKGVKPYGFHGLSYQSIMNQLNEQLEKKIPSRIIIAHLGSGSSVCAVKDGKSIATTMTFSPLDGLPMSTRSGRLDPSAVIYMIEQLKLTPNELLRTLNKESGLKGLSGLSGDVQELLLSTSEDAKFALKYYVNSIVRAIGEMAATLEGLDALIFTGGVGANSAVLREQICEHFQWLGLYLNPAANNQHALKINSNESRIDTYSMKTNEELVMAQWVIAGLNKHQDKGNDS